MGGGGRGIRIVMSEGELEAMFTQASNEALNAVGDGRCFIEKYILKVGDVNHTELWVLDASEGIDMNLTNFGCRLLITSPLSTARVTDFFSPDTLKSSV